MSSLFIDAGPTASGQKVMLATTAYDSPDASYTFSIARSREALTKAGVQSAYLLLSGNCHVDDARNTVVYHFLQSDCTDLVFLDADVSWEPNHLVGLCGFNKDIVGGVYPYRREGVGEVMPVRMLPDVFEPDEDGLLEVDGLPTGFLRIKRHVLESMNKDAKRFYKDGISYPILFERDLFNGGRRSGDIHFCMNWREMGGKLYAAADFRLGHCGKMVIRDSLSASLRRKTNTTLAFVAKALRAGKESKETLIEAVRAVNNPWGAEAEFLRSAVGLARKVSGPILEVGSGLTTIVMAAANPDQKVWCVEHDPHYARLLEGMAAQAGVSNIALITCDMVDGWYDLADVMADLPERFALALVDGPPRVFGDRMKFFDIFGDRSRVILADDADSAAYAGKLSIWAASRNRQIIIDGRSAVILAGLRSYRRGRAWR